MKYGPQYRSRHLALTVLALLSALVSLPDTSDAQQPRIHHSVQTLHNQAPQMGRELWFMLLTNYGQDLGGKYFALYVTSPNVTTVHIQLSGGLTKSIQVTPFKSAVFNIPLGWETKSSGRVEDMGIRVWSNDADICCYVMSHNAYTSDGFYVYPTIGWGTEYVVAGYAALFEGGGSFVYDLPSQFGIVSNTDRTKIVITPTADIRLDASGSTCNVMFAPKGVPTTVILDRGQVIQCKTMCTTDCDYFDLTGSVITSSNPVGVVCGSQCPNIPCDKPYCDHVIEMVPPTRMWAKTYYTVPFFQPPDAPPSHAASTFLVVGSKDNQQVWRYDANGMSANLYCRVNKYETYWRNDIDAGSRWYSDAPFLLVQYVNSASYPDDVNGQGDPAEVVVPPVEQFTKTAVFQLPTSIGNQSPYTNYVNVIANENDKHVTLDGKPIGLSTRVYIDGKYTGYRVSGIATGGHIVKSDSGVGVYIYGYGWDESYAWTGNFANGTFNSTDTIAPLADTSGLCTNAHVQLSDTLYGMDPKGIETGLNFLTKDSSYNMAYILDPQWAEGKQLPFARYDMYVLDPTKPAILIVSGYDAAGNKTTVTSTYRPQAAVLAPPFTDFGVGNAINCVTKYDTLSNVSDGMDFPYTTLKFALGDQGFTLDTTYVKNQLGVNEKRLIRICFRPIKGAVVFDTLLFNDGCADQRVVVSGSGGQADFYITGHDFGIVSTDQKTAPYAVKVHNTSKTQLIRYDRMYVDDTVHFKPLATSAPANYWVDQPKDSVLSDPTINPDVMVKFYFDATGLPDSQYTTHWFVHSADMQNDATGETGWRSAVLSARVVSPSVSIAADQDDTVRCVDPTKNVVPIEVEISASGTASSNIMRIVHTNTTDFTPLVVERQNGTTLARIDTMHEELQPGSKLVIKESVTLPQYANADYYDSITAYYLDAENQWQPVAGSPVKIGVHAVFSSGVLRTTSGSRSVDFAPVAYKSAPVTQTFTLTDTTTQPLEILDATIDDPAFQLSASPTWPITLQPGQSMTFTVQFDPSVSYAENQKASILIRTPASSCALFTMDAHAVVTVTGAALTAFSASNYSTCDNPQANITVHNVKPNAPDDIVDTIVSVRFESTGSDVAGSNFAFASGASPVGKTIHGNGSLDIPVIFKPNMPQATLSMTYCDSVTIVLHNGRALQSYTTIGKSFCDSATTVALTAMAGDGSLTTMPVRNAFTMPLSITQNKNGLTADISNRNITRVKFTIRLNSDLLQLASDIANSFGSSSNWTVDAAASSLTVPKAPAPSTLTLVLIPPGGKLTDANLTQIGSLNFRVTLSPDSNHTAIELASTELIDGNGSTVTGCVTTTPISSALTEKLLCGDSTLRKVMNGDHNLDGPRAPTPNPVKGDVVTITYSNAQEAEMTLGIYDALGKEVLRPVNHIHQNAGVWQVPCNVAALPSGTYTYRVTDGETVFSRQFVIQR